MLARCIKLYYYALYYSTRNGFYGDIVDAPCFDVWNVIVSFCYKHLSVSDYHNILYSIRCYTKLIDPSGLVGKDNQQIVCKYLGWWLGKDTFKIVCG